MDNLFYPITRGTFDKAAHTIDPLGYWLLRVGYVLGSVSLYAPASGSVSQRFDLATLRYVVRLTISPVLAVEFAGESLEAGKLPARLTAGAHFATVPGYVVISVFAGPGLKRQADPRQFFAANRARFPRSSAFWFGLGFLGGVGVAGVGLAVVRTKQRGR
jgi:hypothetical protein